MQQHKQCIAIRQGSTSVKMSELTGWWWWRIGYQHVLTVLANPDDLTTDQTTTTLDVKSVTPVYPLPESAHWKLPYVPLHENW